MWQDILLAVGGFMFSIALVPSILKKEPPNASTCAITALWLWTFCTVYISLELWLTLGAGILSASAWTVLLIQRLRHTTGK